MHLVLSLFSVAFQEEKASLLHRTQEERQKREASHSLCLYLHDLSLKTKC